MRRLCWMMGMLLAGTLAGEADEVVIRRFDKSGNLTFSGVTNGMGYRVEWTTNLAATYWSSNSPGISSIPPLGTGDLAVTVGVVHAACSYRVVALVTNSQPNPPAGMVLIPAGSFVMGATTNMGHEYNSGEIPQHTVYVSAFYLDRFEVTKSLWDSVAIWATGNGYDIRTNSASGKQMDHPAQWVSWYEAVKWCNARSEQEVLTPCYTTNGVRYKTGENAEVLCDWTANGYRLPTEAEWEKAARGGVANHRFPWGDSDYIQHARANYSSSSNDTYDTSPTRGYHPSFFTNAVPYTSPPGHFAANGYGLYDMAGNVNEWCWDRALADYYSISPGIDPRGPSTGTGTGRLARGGSWTQGASFSRVARRADYPPQFNVDYVGFRCARGP